MLVDCMKIKNAAAECGMTHQQLAAASGISVTWINELFRRDSKKVRVVTAGKLCAALGLKTKDIEISQDDLLVRYALLCEKQMEMRSRGLTTAADIIGKEIEKIKRQLV